MFVNTEYLLFSPSDKSLNYVLTITSLEGFILDKLQSMCSPFEMSLLPSSVYKCFFLNVQTLFRQMTNTAKNRPPVFQYIYFLCLLSFQKSSKYTQNLNKKFINFYEVPIKDKAQNIYQQQ